ncbi:MAG: SRPBCC domain-containing protein [Bacteroidota bacterium]
MEIDKLDNRTGGSYRFFHCDAGGNKYGFNGVIHEIAAPERLIRTFEFEGLPERDMSPSKSPYLKRLPAEEQEQLFSPYSNP